MRKRLKHWDVWVIALVVILLALARLKLALTPERSDDGFAGTITLGGIAPGMDSEQVREKLGSLDGTDYVRGDNFYVLGLADTQKISMHKVANEQDLYTVTGVRATTLEVDGKLALQKGAARDAVRQLFGETVAATGKLVLGPGAGALRIVIRGERVESFEINR